jgi:hypothetical protein
MDRPKKWPTSGEGPINSPRDRFGLFASEASPPRRKHPTHSLTGLAHFDAAPKSPYISPIKESAT